MSELEPIAWMFDWVSSEVDKPYTSISLSYPVDEHEVFVSNIRPLYEITVPVLELQRKAKLVDELLEAFEECVGAAIDKYNEKIVQTYDDIGYYPPAVEKYKLRQRYLKELLAKAKGE